MFKIAYCAGHHLGNSKGVPNYMGLGAIREWTINDQVADHFARAALDYEGVSILRTDDSTGKKFIDIPERCAAANSWGADIYIDMHHNGGINGGTGGGVVAFYRPKDKESQKYATAIYDAVIAAGGLRGNRYDTVIATNWLTMKKSKMPAVLMEYGFMDSKTDAPIIITDAYSKQVAYATMEGIAKVAGLKKKPAAPVQPVETTDQIYRIRKSKDDAAGQLGAFVSLDRAKKNCPEGYNVYDKDFIVVYANKATPAPAIKLDYAKSFTKSNAGTYRVSSSIGLKLRAGAGTTKKIIETMRNGSDFTCYGYHTGSWLYGISASGKEGFCHKSLLKKM